MTRFHDWYAGAAWKDNKPAIQHFADMENSDGRSKGVAAAAEARNFSGKTQRFRSRRTRIQYRDWRITIKESGPSVMITRFPIDFRFLF